MKKILLLAVILLSVSAHAQDQVKKLVDRAFVENIHDIQKETGLIVQFHRITYGKLSGDTYFAICAYGLGKKGEKGSIKKEAFLYKVTEEEAQQIGTFTPEYCFVIHKVKKDKVILDEVENCMLTRNTTAIQHKLKLSGNTLVEK